LTKIDQKHDIIPSGAEFCEQDWMIVEADQCESDRFEFLFKEGLHTHGVLNFERAHAKTSKGTDISTMDKMSWSFDKDKAELAY